MSRKQTSQNIKQRATAIDTAFLTTIITAAVTVLVALTGYLITYWNNIRLSQRAAQLDRINRQLAEFYGPLYSLVNTGDQTWRAFREKYRPGRPYFGSRQPPTEEELKAWRLWMTAVFMPQNMQLKQIVISKADLLIETDMPTCLKDLCAHVASYEAVLKQWENNDFSVHTALFDYPGRELLDYSQRSFKRLKEQQSKLTGGLAKR